MKQIRWILRKSIRWLTPSIKPLANMSLDLSKGLFLVAFGFLFFKDPASTRAIVLTLASSFMLVVIGVVLFGVARNIEEDQKMKIQRQNNRNKLRKRKHD